MRLALVATLATLVVTPALAEDFVFTLINESSHTIVEMYIAPANQQDWGDDILAGVEVASGETGDVTIADVDEVCDYDLRFVTAEGGEVEQTQDLCELEVFTVTD